MNTWSKFEPLIIFISLILGYCASYLPMVSSFCQQIEEYLFLTLLFFIFLEIDWTSIKKGFNNRKFLFLDLIINFLWTPILAYLLGSLLFGDSIYLKIALILLLLLPCTDWYLIFTGLSNGNVALSASVLPFNLIFQLISLPIYLFLFYGYNGIMVDFGLGLDIVLELLLPFVLSIIVRLLTWKVPKLQHQLHELSDKIEFILISIIAFVIFASEGSGLLYSISSFPIFILAVILFYIINFVISYNLGRKLKFKPKDTISLVFVSTSRNTPLSLTLAGLLFPQFRLISIILLMGPITEIPFSLMVSVILKGLFKKKQYDHIKKGKLLN